MSVDYEGMNPKARAVIKLTPQIKSIKLTRLGADVSTFLGSRNVRNKKITFHAAGRKVVCKLYYPASCAAKDCLLYFHGGGFMYGGLGTADGGLKDYCAKTKQMVISVRYSLAPENPYPCAVNECFEIARQIFTIKDKLHVDEIYIAGDSAGGNLACVTAERLGKEGLRLKGMFLLYPFAELVSEGIEEKYPSMEKFKSGCFLEAKDLKFMTEHYAPKGCDVWEPTLSPIYGDLKRYPPTIIFVCGYDPLRDMGIKLYERIKSSGIETELVEFPDIIHGYFSMFKDYADKTIEKAVAFFGLNRP